jgi:hypothetical protein
VASAMFPPGPAGYCGLGRPHHQIFVMRSANNRYPHAVKCIHTAHRLQDVDTTGHRTDMAQNLITRFARQTGSSLVTVPHGLSFEMVPLQHA